MIFLHAQINTFKEFPFIFWRPFYPVECVYICIYVLQIFHNISQVHSQGNSIIIGHAAEIDATNQSFHSPSLFTFPPLFL